MKIFDIFLLLVIFLSDSIANIDTSHLSQYVVPESMVIRDSHKGAGLVESGKLSQLFQKAADKGKRAMGLRRRLRNISLNSTEIIRAGITPVLLFVNRKSGGKHGSLLLESLKRLVNDVQICDVLSGTPREYLSLFAQCSKNLRIVCCGGDGTVSWIIQEMNALGMQDVPVSIIPLGTGNDLQQALAEECRKPAYISIPSPTEPVKFFMQFQRGKEISIDQWTLTSEPLFSSQLALPGRIPTSTRLRSLLPPKSKLTKKSITNYFGIGVDGHISLIFDELRSKYPVLFFSQTINKFLYMLVGIFYFLIHKQRDLHSLVHMECDGIPIDIPLGTRGIIVMNINSYAGGSKLWNFDGAQRSGGSGKWRPTSASDQILEVVAVSGIAHLGQIKAGLANAIPIAQGSKLKIVCKRKLPVQVDGEPWRQYPCRMTVESTGRIKFVVPKETN